MSLITQFPKPRGGFKTLGDQPQVMGVLNVTPDSFSDGGQYFSANNGSMSKALGRARQMVEEGATFIDVGGESTRPGALPVSVQQELDRVIPVIEGIAQELDCVISVDTSRPEVMIEAVAAGAGLLNDVRAFSVEGAVDVAVKSSVPLCIMHMQGEPDAMQSDPRYFEVVKEVKAFLSLRAQALQDAGVESERIILDPGFGFGKSLDHNLCLLGSLDEIVKCGFPVLVGLSRKSMLGALLGKEVGDRLSGSLALAALAVINGANIIRAHDVAETVDAVKVAFAVKDFRGSCFKQ